MYTLDVSIPVLNQEESTQKAFDSLKSTMAETRRYIMVDNGCDRFIRDWLIGLNEKDLVIKNQVNVGLPKAMNQALKVSESDFVFFTHSDIEMFNEEWDLKVLKVIEQAEQDTGKKVGVAGFFGALGIGSGDIYRTPYSMYQLARQVPVSGDLCKLDPSVHHQTLFHDSYKQVAVLDGFSLIVRNDGNLKFWDSSVHHNYDNNMCLEAWNKGYIVICINMSIQHYGGRTDVNEDWASKFGKTKAEIHAESHLPLYEKWKPENKVNGINTISLPFWV